MCQWDLFSARFSIISIYPILKIRYLITFKTFNIHKICWRYTYSHQWYKWNKHTRHLPKNLVLNLIHELNENKILFLDVLIDTNNINNDFTTSTDKKHSNYNFCTLNFKNKCPFRYIKKKKAIINNLISSAKLISTSEMIFYKELKKHKINSI